MNTEAFDLYSPEIDADPFPYYATLREQYPCYWSENARLWILSRYDDIVQAGLGNILVVARQHDRRAAWPRRSDAGNH